MMMWSKIFISKNCPALTKLLVICLSALLGNIFPEGWLWHNIILAALFSKAHLKIFFGSAVVQIILYIDN